MKLIDRATLDPGEASFFVMPFNRKVLGPNTPVAQSPENTVKDGGSPSSVSESESGS